MPRSLTAPASATALERTRQPRQRPSKGRFERAEAGKQRHVSITRRLLVVLGVALWGIGAYLIVIASYYLAGGVIVLGALCLVIAASGGWAEFFEGLGNWLYFGH
ncbi:MAG: hypothetical protein M3N47_06445 [Chloroflexota bacterium]|nr:hypothetical protein [Chloroflexota bacterium]